MQKMQKCVRLSSRVCKYIEGYRGSNFTEKLENYVLDTEERREQLILEYNLLSAQIEDKHHEMVMIQDRVRRMRNVDQRFSLLVDALLDLLKTS